MRSINDLMKETGVPVVIADQEGCITYVNESFEAVFHWKADEIVGRSLTTIIPGNLHDAHHMGFSRFVFTGRPTLLDKPLRLKALTKDGKIMEAEHCIVAEKHQGKWQFGATICPVEEG